MSDALGIGGGVKVGALNTASFIGPMLKSITVGIGKSVGAVFKTIGSTLMKSMGALGMLMRVLDALGIAEPIFAILEAFVSILGIAFMPVVTQIVQMLIPFLPTLVGLSLAMQPLVLLMVNLLTPLQGLNYILPYINTGLQYLTNALNAVNWDSIKTFFTNLPGQIIGWIGEQIYVVRDWFTNLPHMIADWIRDAGDVILNAFKSLFWL
jgi:hypothetical protein